MAETKPPMPVTILGWRKLKSNTLRGFASVRLGALQIHEITVHELNDRRWCGLPARPVVLNRELQMENGKVRYARILDWANKEAADRFSTAVIAELERTHPDAFAP